MSRTRRRPPLAALIFGGLAAIAVLGTVWVGVRGALAATHLVAVQQIVGDLPSAVTTVTDDVPSLLADLQEETDAAHALTADPIWTAAESLPWAGPQLAAVGAISESVDVLAQEALPALAEVFGGGGTDAFRPRDGALPLDAIAQLGETTPAMDAAAAEAVEALDRVPLAPLVGPLRAVFDQATEAVGQVGGFIEAIDNAARLLPPMLGADEPRDYLLVFQNNAELRSLGGMPGSLVHLHAEGGRIDLVEQYAAADFAVSEPVGTLSDELAALYRGPEKVISATTEIPDFSVVADLLDGYWAATHEGELDGVIAIDPVALSYLLQATGPVALPDGSSLSADNAVDVLLNEVYLELDPVEQNAYFASATTAVFDALTRGDYDPAALVAALAQAGGERRLLVHSKHPEEQATLDSTTLAGPLPGPGQFGVYLNDGTGSKLGYYQRARADVADSTTTPGAVDLTVTISSEAPADAAELPPSVSGGSYGVPAGIARTVVYIYLPPGFAVSESDAGGFTGFTHGTHDGRQVLVAYADLAPGEEASTRISAVALTAGEVPPPTVVMTPQAH